MEFYGFVDNSGAVIHDEILRTPPAYMLVKLNHDVGVPVALPGLPPSVIGVEPDVFTYYGGNGKKMTYTQFAATLAYAITDYKCQAKTFEWVVVDIKKPGGRGSSPAASAYVQLSRAKTRHSLSILRPFDPTELSSKLSTELLQELEWQAEKAKETEALYNF